MALVVPSLFVDSRGCDVGTLSKSQKRKSRIKRNAIFKSKALTEHLHELLATDRSHSFDVTPTVDGALDARLRCIEHKLDLLLNFHPAHVPVAPTNAYEGAIAGALLARQCLAARCIQVAWKRRYALLHAAAIAIQGRVRGVLVRRKSAYQIQLDTPEVKLVQDEPSTSAAVQVEEAVINGKPQSFVTAEPRIPPSAYFLYTIHCSCIDNEGLNLRWSTMTHAEKEPFETLSHELKTTYAKQVAEWRARGCYSGQQPCTKEYVRMRLSKISSVSAVAEASTGREEDEEDMNEPEFSHIQLYCAIEMAVQQFWANAETQASRAGISQEALNDVACHMRKAFPCDEETQDQPFFSKAQMQQLLEVVSAECLNAMRLALDKVMPV